MSDHLPVHDVLDELLEALDEPGAAVLVAPPGTGKTTVVPPVLAAQTWAGSGRIVVVEPRRLAARLAAARMAELDGSTVGGRVGYAVRGERRSSADTRIEVVTEGLFLRRLQHDPTLEGVGAVVLDEFHERSIDLDLTLTLLCDVRASLREDLRLLVMSATIDPGPVATMLGDDTPAPVIEAHAPLFPVETRHRPGSAHDPIEARTAAVIAESLRSDPGDVLVFLPGRPEIRRTARELAKLGPASRAPEQVQVLELHGSLSPAEQDQVVTPPTAGRRVILSTSLAETSITVPGVRVVVDAGRRRRVGIDPHTSLPRLQTGPVSRAGADQRRGRAGRTAPGVAYRLWAETDERHRPAADIPEILDGDLAPLVLQLLSWGVHEPDELRWLDPPPPAALVRARALLVDLGAVQAGSLTEAGREMADIGFHPRLAAIAGEGRRRQRRSLAADVLAVLESSRAGEVDLVERVRQLQEGDAEGDLRHARRLWRRTLEVGAPDDHGRRDDPSDGAIAQLVLAGFADRMARRRAGARADDRGRESVVFHLRSGGEVAVPRAHPFARCDWLVVADLDAGAPGVPGRVHLAAGLDADLVDDVVQREAVQVEAVEWDTQRRDVLAERRMHLGAITLRSEPLPHPGPEALSQALLRGVHEHGLGLLDRFADADTLRARVAWLRATRPDDGWPDWSDDTLLATVEHWLVPRLGRARRRSDLARVDVVGALSDQLDWARRRALDELAPTTWTTPSGRRVRLAYGAVDGEPATVVASVRLRDVLGSDEHPTVGPARIPVTLELLSPAGRPVQRTTDLPGFWRGSYAAVRADMRGRYPKHPWPERPWEPSPRR